MIRSAGRLGPVKAAGLVAWQLRYDLLAVLVVAAIMVPIPDAIQSRVGRGSLGAGHRRVDLHRLPQQQRLQPVVEARTLWGGIIINSRALHNTLCSVDTGAPAMFPPSTGCAGARFATSGSWPPDAGIAPLPGVAG